MNSCPNGWMTLATQTVCVLEACPRNGGSATDTTFQVKIGEENYTRDFNFFHGCKLGPIEFSVVLQALLGS